MTGSDLERDEDSRWAELVARLEPGRAEAAPDVLGVRVPLRVCPLGAHVDHQGGVVTGLAIDRSVDLVATRASGPSIEVESLGFPGRVAFDATAEPNGPEGHWGDYLRAAAAALGRRRRIRRGMHAVVRGDLASAGLSSSAAVLIAYLAGLAWANGVELAADEIVDLVRSAENEYIGVSSGVLDPSIMVHAELGRLTVVDCRDLAVRQVAAPDDGGGLAVLIAFSGIRRSLVASGFNARVAECGDAARALVDAAGCDAPRSPRLRDVDPRVYAEEGRRLPRNLRLRAEHFFTEMERVRRGVRAWRDGDLVRFGELVTASGESSIVNYECGIPPLVTLYELLRSEPGVLGARFSGGGFGGSCVAFAVPDACDGIVSSVSRRYARAHPGPAQSATYTVCAPAGPVRLARLEV